MILTETKIFDKAYCPNYLGYDVVCSPAAATATGSAQEGVGLVIRERPKVWSVELTRFHGTNVVSCKFISSGQRTLLIREYPPLHPVAPPRPGGGPGPLQ